VDNLAGGLLHGPRYHCSHSRSRGALIRKVNLLPVAHTITMQRTIAAIIMMHEPCTPPFSSPCPCCLDTTSIPFHGRRESPRSSLCGAAPSPLMLLLCIATVAHHHASQGTLGTRHHTRLKFNSKQLLRKNLTERQTHTGNKCSVLIAAATWKNFGCHNEMTQDWDI